MYIFCLAKSFVSSGAKPGSIEEDAMFTIIDSSIASNDEYTLLILASPPIATVLKSREDEESSDGTALKMRDVERRASASSFFKSSSYRVMISRLMRSTL